ncbi:MAG: hypothetical protein M1826_000359 [Phylliscum demangeonii]|nr:MAG: hypothetical protein M1826_000359 [Phylliscum demangeonii]
MPSHRAPKEKNVLLRELASLADVIRAFHQQGRKVTHTLLGMWHAFMGYNSPDVAPAHLASITRAVHEWHREDIRTLLGPLLGLTGILPRNVASAVLEATIRLGRLLDPIGQIDAGSSGGWRDGGNAAQAKGDSTCEKDERQLVLQAELWGEDTDGHEKYFHTIIVYRVGAQLFHAHDNSQRPDIPLDLLQGHPIVTHDILPVYLPSLTRASDELVAEGFIKQPHVLDLVFAGDDLKELMAQEASVYEILERSPHPNLGRYHGCVEKDGHITGLCLAKYAMTLEEQILVLDRPLDQARVLNGIRSGLLHLHRLGLAHNDVKPDNIMFRAGDDQPVIIDFDSCRPIGERLGRKGGTTGWAKPYTRLAMPENDFYGLERVREFLADGKSPALEHSDLLPANLPSVQFKSLY